MLFVPISLDNASSSIPIGITASSPGVAAKRRTPGEKKQHANDPGRVLNALKDSAIPYAPQPQFFSTPKRIRRGQAPNRWANSDIGEAGEREYYAF